MSPVAVAAEEVAAEEVAAEEHILGWFQGEVADQSQGVQSPGVLFQGGEAVPP
jgi:hypothetical protein